MVVIPKRIHPFGKVQFIEGFVLSALFDAWKDLQDAGLTQSSALARAP